MPLQILSPDPAIHRLSVAQLVNMQWERLAARLRDPHHDWPASRIGVIEDRIVTLWAVFDLTIRIGVARVRSAGVDCVVTDPAYRRRGYMTMTAQAAMTAMPSNGYALSLLNGIPGFYERFGYVNVWPQRHYVVETVHLPAERPPYALDEFAPAHRDELAALYNAENEDNAGTAVRPTYRTFKYPGLYSGYLWQDGDGKPLGYVVADHEPANEKRTVFTCVDMAGEPEQILRLTGLLARQKNYERVCFERLHPNSRLARHLRRRTCLVETRYAASGDFMAAVVDLSALLTQLAPELSRRLAASPLAGWSGELKLSLANQTSVLSIGASRVSVRPSCVTPHEARGDTAMARLIMGADSPEDLVETAEIKTSGDALALLHVLFPARQLQIASVDL
ncbi:MAG: GNAT family N-acetyltransferase [candidate division Zixibacteria bacterium]|nr:GNAT family N-acetyltransferase [candidate division Zixibacteria bacterium]